MPAFSHMIGQEEAIERYAPLLIETARKISAARGMPSERFEYPRTTQ